MAYAYTGCVLLECDSAEAAAEILALIPGRCVLWKMSDSVVMLEPDDVDEVVAVLKRHAIAARVTRT